MDRWDVIEFAGIVFLVLFAVVVWWPAAFLTAGIALIVEAQLRSLQPTPPVEEPAE